MVIRSMILALVLIFVSVAKPAIAQSRTDAYCLALTVFTEARAEGEHGMALVAHTVLNRADRRNKSICQVAYAPHQYTGVLRWPSNRHPRDHNPKAWQAAMSVVERVLSGNWDFGECTGADHFYAPKLVYAAPRWAYKIPLLCEYRGHKFYGVT